MDKDIIVIILCLGSAFIVHALMAFFTKRQRKKEGKQVYQNFADELFLKYWWILYIVVILFAVLIGLTAKGPIGFAFF